MKDEGSKDAKDDSPEKSEGYSRGHRSTDRREREDLEGEKTSLSDLKSRG